MSGSVQATDRLMKELRDIYRSPSFKGGEYRDPCEPGASLVLQGGTWWVSGMDPSLCAQLAWAESQVLGCCGSAQSGAIELPVSRWFLLQDSLCQAEDVLQGSGGGCSLGDGSSPCLVPPPLLTHPFALQVTMQLN